MNEPIESVYFNWLCAKVLENDTRDYEFLMEILFKTEFVWVVSADEHRASDAMDLRQEFLSATHLIRNSMLNQIPCSIFEVLIAFSNRAAFQTDSPAKSWFMRFLVNLDLDRFRTVSDSDIPLIEDILYTFTWRVYEPNGVGGLFPLDHTDKDQRDVEIWYQFCEYVIALGLV